MQAFTVRNITGTVYLTVWATSSADAAKQVFGMFGKRSTLRVVQVNGHGKH